MTSAPSIFRILRHLKGVVSLTRPVNGGIAFLCIVATGYLAGRGWEYMGTMLAAGLAGALIGSAGNVINDVYDIDIDRINRPGRALPAGLLRPVHASVWAGVFGFAGLGISLAFSPVLFAIGLASLALLWLYSARLKGTILIGNIVVALLTGTAFLFGAVAAGAPEAGFVPAGFALLINFARELLKDVEDIEGDRRNGLRTFPIVVSPRTALRYVAFVLGGVAVLSPLPYVLGWYSVWYAAIVGIGVDVVLLVVIRKILANSAPLEISRAGALLKYAMIVGLGAFICGMW